MDFHALARAHRHGADGSALFLPGQHQQLARAFLVGDENRRADQFHRAKQGIDLFLAAGCQNAHRNLLQGLDAHRHDEIMNRVIDEASLLVVEVEQDIADRAAFGQG